MKTLFSFAAINRDGDGSDPGLVVLDVAVNTIESRREAIRAWVRDYAEELDIEGWRVSKNYKWAPAYGELAIELPDDTVFVFRDYTPYQLTQFGLQFVPNGGSE